MTDDENSKTNDEIKKLVDSDIVSEQKIWRKSFLNETGVLIFGALSIVLSGSCGSNGKQESKETKTSFSFPNAKHDMKTDSDRGRMADRHLTDGKGGENDDWDPDSDMRTFGDGKKDSD